LPCLREAPTITSLEPRRGAFHETNGRVRVRSFQGQGGGGADDGRRLQWASSARSERGAPLVWAHIFPRTTCRWSPALLHFRTSWRFRRKVEHLFLSDLRLQHPLGSGVHSLRRSRGCRRTFADPSFPPPQIAIYTENQHSWVTLPAGTMPFEREPTDEVLAFADERGGS